MKIENSSFVLDKNWVRKRNETFYRGWHDGHANIMPIEVVTAMDESERQDYLHGHHSGWFTSPRHKELFAAK